MKLVAATAWRRDIFGYICYHGDVDPKDYSAVNNKVAEELDLHPENIRMTQGRSGEASDEGAGHDGRSTAWTPLEDPAVATVETYGQAKEERGSVGSEVDGRKQRKQMDRAIGIRIRGRRRELNLGQRELADKLGVTREAVTGWESGRISIYAGDLPRLAEILTVPLIYLYRGVNTGYGRQQLLVQSAYHIKGAKMFGVSTVSSKDEELLECFRALPEKLKEAVLSHTHTLLRFWDTFASDQKAASEDVSDREVNTLAKPE